MSADNIHLNVEGISLSFGGILALNDISFKAREGQILAIIGPNGAGKTSLLNCLNNFGSLGIAVIKPFVHGFHGQKG